jgi:hypothetical protein
VTDSVFLVVDNDADDLATFAGALTSRYASEYEIRTAATASEAHGTLAALSVAGITVALLIVSRDLGDADLHAAGGMACESPDLSRSQTAR